jgi:predicted nucleic acid-binding protein
MSGDSVLDVSEPSVLLDTDVFVDHLRGARQLPGFSGSYSVITRAELFAGAETDEPAVRALLELHTEIDVDSSIAERAGRLRRTASMRMPDALIAATALEQGLDLVTRNRRDFAKVHGLRVRDPAAV